MSIRIPKKIIAIVIVFSVFVLSLILFGKSPETSLVKTVVNSPAATVNVKAGYNPHEVVLPANEQTSLRFVTNNTYDCSASLVIPKLDIEQFLPPTGSTDIVIPAQKAGTEIIAGCSMGMYSLKIRFL